MHMLLIQTYMGGVKGSSSVTSHTHGHPHPSSALRPTCILWFQPAPHYHAALSLSPISPPIGFLPSSILTLPAEDGHRVKGAGEEEGHVPFGAAGSDTAGGWQELGWRAAIVRPEVQGGERWDNPAGWGRRLKVGDSDGGSKDRVEPQCRAGRSSFPLQRSSSLLYTVHKCVLSCRGGGSGETCGGGGDISGEPKERQESLRDREAQIWGVCGGLSARALRALPRRDGTKSPVSF